MVFPCQGFLDEFDAVFLCFLSPPVRCRYYRDAIRCNAYVSQEEGQHALPDAAKTDDQYPSREIHIDFVIAHDAPTLTDDSFNAANEADKCDRSREVPPRARPIDPAPGN